MVKRTKRYPYIGVAIRAKGLKFGDDGERANDPLLPDDARDLLGWVQEGDEGQPDDFEGDYLFRDVEGNKVRLLNNLTNRPFRRTLAMRYANEMLRGKWRFNGETLIIDEYGDCQDCQHRLAGLIFAEQMRARDPDKYKDFGWPKKGPVYMSALIVTGIPADSETVDTIGLGQKRSLGDVLFRRREFEGVDEKTQKQMAQILSHATRLVWLRVGGKTVSDAPHFPHSEAIDFIESHPRLLDAVLHVVNEEGGRGVEGRQITGAGISLGYAAGLCYLMGTAATERHEYDTDGTIDDSLWDKAETFWTLFASGAGLEKGDPILALRKRLPRLETSSQGRDEIIGTVAKAWGAWLDGEKATAAKIKVKQTVDKNDGRKKLAEIPRVGGLDVDISPEPSEGPQEGPEEPAEGSDDTTPAPSTSRRKRQPRASEGTSKKRRRKADVGTPPESAVPEEQPKRRMRFVAPDNGIENVGGEGGWNVGATVWVYDDDGEHWLGTIRSFTDDKKIAWMTPSGQDKEWEVPIQHLRKTNPADDGQ
jgi:hypothetical protein